MKAHLSHLFTAALLTSSAFSSSAQAQAKDPPPSNIDFTNDVQPIFEAACVHCHDEDSNEKEGGDYRMDTKELAFKGGKDYNPSIVAGDPNESPVWWMTTEPADGDVMPAKPKTNAPLTKIQQNILEAWVKEGAKWPDDIELVSVPRLNFKVNVLPILRKGAPFSAKKIDTLKTWIAQGALWPINYTLPLEGEAKKIAAPAGNFTLTILPLLQKGGEFSVKEIATLSKWTKDGAPWPENYKLPLAEEKGPKDDLTLTANIRKNILSKSTEETQAAMKNYSSKIPETGVDFEMVALKGGTFTMGSPLSEKGRNQDESPQHQVTIAPFWMGKFEVTWNMYEPYEITDLARRKDGFPEKVSEDTLAQGLVSAPTSPYSEMSFGMGTDGFPAISMTQHAANKFCQWLSAQTGHFYRLPTEAEWEYACRAGTTTTYSFGDNPADLKDYAVFDAEQYAKVGSKKPNPWGLYDMHGNVLEWVLDQHAPYSKKTATNPWVKATQLYPRVARGGSWYDYAKDCRSAMRIQSDKDWKMNDPQLPQSIWYHTDAEWLGFRLVRPLKVPSAKAMHEYWNLGVIPEDDDY
ncbi:MAG: SUMF1/EgtB/PvdO family nonheme iron enzyme [Verrucomicrobiales bacterium]|nr:SUMF1/EgtB/PvdO family nonheme iron enzyme [Verrucomicrobiales bacterium]